MDTLHRHNASSSGWRVGDRDLTLQDEFEVKIAGDSLVCSLNIGQALCNLGHIDLPLLEGFETRLLTRQVRSEPDQGASGAPAPCMAMKGQRGVALELLRRFIESARSLIVCDAYFFADGTAEHVEDFMSILPLGTIQTVEIFFREKPDWVVPVQQALAERNVSLQLYRTRDIHDRIWIADGNKAIHVGTSFNGLGRQTAFLLSLPDEDLAEFLEVLTEIRNGSQPFHRFLRSRAVQRRRDLPPRPAPPVQKGSA
jgi:hypothetical protein